MMYPNVTLWASGQSAPLIGMNSRIGIYGEGFRNE